MTLARGACEALLKPLPGPPFPQPRRDGQSTPSKSGGGGGGKGAADANAPAWDRVPLPSLKDADRAERRSRQRDLERSVRLGPKTLPPVCFYTIANAATRGGCPVATFTEDGSKMAAGFEVGFHFS